MRLSKNHVDYMAFLVHRALRENPRVELKNPDLAVSIVRTRVLENLHVEQEIEKEAEAIVKKHRAEIMQTGADYRKLVREGMKSIARKRGFTL